MKAAQKTDPQDLQTARLKALKALRAKTPEQLAAHRRRCRATVARVIDLHGLNGAERDGG